LNQDQVPHMWDLILAPACLQFYKITDISVWVKGSAEKAISYWSKLSRLNVTDNVTIIGFSVLPALAISAVHKAEPSDI